MCRKLICLTVFYLFSGMILSGTANAELVGWWKLDETSGNVAADSSGNGYDGTVYGDAQWITGHVDGALEFDGTDDYVDLPIGSVIASLSDCTIMTWANFSNTGGAWQRLWDFGSDTTFYMFLCPRIGTGAYGIMRFAITQSSNVPGAEFQLNAEETLASGWHHVAVVIDGVNMYMYFYLDGALIDDGPTETLPLNLGETTQNWLGRSQWIADGYYSGSLDDVRIYNNAFSEYQIHTMVDDNYRQAWKLRPDNGQQDVAFGAKLIWNPGVVDAETGELYNEHQLYIGTDFNDVNSATVPTVTVTDVNEYIPLLDYNTTYYWRVDEASELDPNGPVKGNILSFTALNFIVVEDFEDYNDWEPYTIYLTWIDGWDDPQNGATAGYPSPVFFNGEHYMETDIFHGGGQSMPVFYDNSAGMSEVTRTFNADWTVDDAMTLTLFYYGDASNNIEPMYVALDGDAIVMHDNPRVVLHNDWQRWDISLQEFADQGVDLTNVVTMSIGMGDKVNPQPGGGTGRVFFDDIRLYRSAPEESGLPESVDPGTDNLVAYYAFENNLEDSSGNGLHGTLQGDPVYVSGATGYGMAMWFDASFDHVELPLGSAIGSMSDITVACWADFSNEGGSWQRIWDFGVTPAAGSDPNFYMFLTPRWGTEGELRFAIAAGTETYIESDTTLPSDWHHVTAIIDSSSMAMRLYQDGRLVAEGVTPFLPSDVGETNQNYLARSQFAADAFYLGSIDEFRIYDRSLSLAEVRYLAGR